MSTAIKLPDGVKMSAMDIYTHDKMRDDLVEFVEGSKNRSGYANLDAITSLYPGMYVIGAISSLGKTTFIHQMSDQIAAAGNPVLYFSFEQSRLELASKSLSRILAQKNADIAMTSLQIRKHGKDPRVAEALTEYDKFSQNLYVAECTFQATITTIEETVNSYIQHTGKKPVVVIDYLQVIHSPDSHMSSKGLVDMHVQHLKQLQDDNKIVLIVISSLNRQNYLTQVDFESFKESGGIEYTADVVWGLQLEVLHDDLFNAPNKINEKREKVREAKAANPRRIELVCLKNRFGISSYSCLYNYYPQFDYFVADMEGIDLKSLSNNMDQDGFSQIPVQYKLPFA